MYKIFGSVTILDDTVTSQKSSNHIIGRNSGSICRGHFMLNLYHSTTHIPTYLTLISRITEPIYRFGQVSRYARKGYFLFVCLCVCLSVSSLEPRVLIASSQDYTSLYLEATRWNRFSFRRSRSKVKVRKNLGKLEKSLSLTWAEISKNHNFDKSNDNRFKFHTRIPKANIYRHCKFGPDRIWIT